MGLTKEIYIHTDMHSKNITVFLSQSGEYNVCLSSFRYFLFDKCDRGARSNVKIVCIVDSMPTLSIWSTRIRGEYIFPTMISCPLSGGEKTCPGSLSAFEMNIMWPLLDFSCSSLVCFPSGTVQSLWQALPTIVQT